MRTRRIRRVRVDGPLRPAVHPHPGRDARLWWRGRAAAQHAAESASRLVLTSAALAAAITLTAPGLADAGTPGPVTITDPAGDVSPAGSGKLDIRRVTVKNTATEVVVRVAFPGVAKTYDFPTGNVSVWLNTDPGRRGAEFGHFTEFWSDYRFAPVRGWREQATDDGCEGELRSDRRSRLRWFRFTVTKEPGCVTGDAVRVAVSRTNTGDLEPFVEYAAPVRDHLGAEHQWTDWVTVR